MLAQMLTRYGRIRVAASRRSRDTKAISTVDSRERVVSHPWRVIPVPGNGYSTAFGKCI